MHEGALGDLAGEPEGAGVVGAEDDRDGRGVESESGGRCAEELGLDGDGFPGGRAQDRRDARVERAQAGERGPYGMPCATVFVWGFPAPIPSVSPRPRSASPAAAFAVWSGERDGIATAIRTGMDSVAASATPASTNASRPCVSPDETAAIPSRSAARQCAAHSCCVAAKRLSARRAMNAPS